jgi:hypothetical protein
MSGLEASIDRIAAETRFSGVVWVDRGGDVQLAKAYGLAHRGHGSRCSALRCAGIRQKP